MITRYNSHVPLLKKIAELVKINKVLELGSGGYSTKLFLDKEAFPDLTKLISYEDSEEWFDMLGREIVDKRFDYLFIDGGIHNHHDMINSSGFDLIFIDNGVNKKQRIATIQEISKRKPKSIVVIHDCDYKEYVEAADFDNKFIYKANADVGVFWNGNHKIKSIKKVKWNLTGNKKETN